LCVYIHGWQQKKDALKREKQLLDGTMKAWMENISVMYASWSELAEGGGLRDREKERERERKREREREREREIKTSATDRDKEE
jgi:hypothetical protein